MKALPVEFDPLLQELGNLNIWHIKHASTNPCIFCNVSLMTLAYVCCVKYFRCASRYVESLGAIRLFKIL